MQRTDLLAKLETVAPALANNDLIPILCHFWFRGDTVHCFNDQISIQTTCKTDIKAALPGGTLLSLLKNSRAKEIEFIPQDDATIVKAASSKLTLPHLPPDRFLFEMPKPASDPIVIPDLLKAIESCLRSTSDDTSVPEQLGVTIEVKDGYANFYSTDDVTLSHAKCKIKDDFKRVTLPGAFCKQLLQLGKSGDFKFYLADDHALAVTSKTSLFGRLVEVEQPLDFAGILQHHTPKGKWHPIPIPSKLKLILERAVIITDSPTDQSNTTISVKDGKMRFASKSGRGEVIDYMQVPDHPDVSIKVRCKYLKAGLDDFTEFLVTESCVIMGKGDRVYFVAAAT